MHILVSIAGIAIMAGVAYYVSWSKRQDYKPALSGRSSQGTSECGAKKQRQNEELEHRI